MGSFSKQIPLNSDSSLGPVTIGSKIMVEKGKDPLPLEGGNVELVPGSGWDAGTVTISKQMTPARNKLDILVKLAPEIPLAHYISVILKKRPIKLKVTLFPRMLVPGMGLPVNVSAAPVTDDVDITIPGVPQPDIDLDVKFTGKTGSGSYHVLVTALVKLPPYISKKDREAVAKKITIDITKPKNVLVEKGELAPDEDGATCELIATPEFTPKTGTPTVTIIAKASLPNISLKKEKQVSFEPPKNYILNIHPGSLEVKKNKAATLTAQVLEVLNEDRKVLVTDAKLSIEGGSDLVLCSPDRGTGKFECKVSQQKVTGEKQVVLSVHASAGNDSVKPQTVPVSLETIDYGSLDVVFVPPAKNHLNPYVKTDQVFLRARLVPPPGKPPVKADIEFVYENPEGWLAGPSDYTLTVDPNNPITGPADTTISLPSSGSGSDTSAVDGDNARTVRFTGRIADPEMKKKPRESESVVVKAIVDGEVVDQKPVSITLDVKQTLTASTTDVTFLATAKQDRPGRPGAPVSVPVSLSVTDPGDGEWKISVEYEESEKQMVSFKEQDKKSSSEVFLFEIAEADKIPRLEPKPGVAPGQLDIEVRTYATQGDLRIEGPIITITLLYEGIYPKSLSDYDKEGKRLPVTGKGRVTINVLDPSEKRAPLETVDDVVGRHMFPYVTFENWEWNGTKLANVNCTDIFAVDNPQEFKENSPAGDQWYFIFSLKDAEMVVAYSGDRGGALSDSTWHITFQKQIPGMGEEAKGFVRFYRSEYFHPTNPENSNWYYDLPVTLKLGNANELKEQMSFIVEGGRCEKIIEKCFPEQYRAKLRESLDNLEYKGANDYRVFSWEIHKTAYEIWEKDNKDFLIWDNRWSNLIYVAEKTEFAGDLAFNALVMFYTAPAGPVASLGLATIATEIKTESLAIYSYYVMEGKGMGYDFPTCISVYTEKHWVEIFEGLLIKTPVELFILRKFDLKELLSNPKKYGVMLAWLWLWKFSVHLKEDGENEGGFLNSAKKASIELGELLLTLILADFVKAHGRTNIKKLYGDVRAKGFFGGTEISPEKTDKPPEKGKTDKDKPPEKDKPDKDKPPEKDKPDKDKPPEKDKPDKDKPPEKDKPDKDKPPEKEKQPEKDKAGKTADTHPDTPLGKEYREITFKDAPGADVEGLMKGMTAEQVQNFKEICAKENVDILVRDTTPHAERLIREGLADPKPEHVKTKTIDENDIRLSGSLTEADLGKVGYFEPRKPVQKPGESPEAFAQVEARYKQRQQEFLDQKTNIEECSNLDASTGKRLVVENGKVKKVLSDGTTRDITGDPDIMSVLDHTTGRPVSDPAKMERIFNYVKEKCGVQHPWQSQWDYRNESKIVPPGSPPGTQSPYKIKEGIDRKILDGHNIDKNPKAKPLIRFGPDDNVTGSYISGVSEP